MQATEFLNRVELTGQLADIIHRDGRRMGGLLLVPCASGADVLTAIFFAGVAPEIIGELAVNDTIEVHGRLGYVPGRQGHIIEATWLYRLQLGDPNAPQPVHIKRIILQTQESQRKRSRFRPKRR